MMSTYTKPHLSFANQLKVLIDRGMEVTDEAAALDYLRRIGYYRLSAYWYPLRKFEARANGPAGRPQFVRANDFLAGSRFVDVADLYVFDKKLRLLVLDAIERLEVAVRVDIAHHLGKSDRFAQVNPDFFNAGFTKKINAKNGETSHQTWLRKHDKLVADSREMFAVHFKTKYGLPLPIWASIELWDFGMLSTFYSGMLVPDQSKIAESFGIPDWQVMQSWLRSINFVRNVTAHHSRLWNKNLVDQPRLPKLGAIPEFDPIIGDTHAISRIYVVLCILSHFLNKICPNSSWNTRVTEHLGTLPKLPNVSLNDMGFPQGWEKHDFWN
jgi:abortive infection bacteriophage resistance protein